MDEESAIRDEGSSPQPSTSFVILSHSSPVMDEESLIGDEQHSPQASTSTDISSDTSYLSDSAASPEEPNMQDTIVPECARMLTYQEIVYSDINKLYKLTENYTKAKKKTIQIIRKQERNKVILNFIINKIEICLLKFK